MAIRTVCSRCGWGLILILGTMCAISCQTQAAEPPFVDQLRQAERILIIAPEKDIDVPGGEQYLVEILRVLRGSGQKGTLARIVQSGDAKSYPKFTAKQQYVFLLKKNADGKGWINLSEQALPLVNNKLSYVDSDGKKAELPLDAVQDLIAKNPYSAPAEAVARTSLEGLWIVALSQQGTDFFVWLVDITKSGNKFDAKLMSTSKVMSASALKSAEIEDGQARLVFETEDGEFEFIGKLHKGLVKGSIAVDDRAVLAARMIPHDGQMKAAYDKPQTTPGQEAFISAVGKENPFSALSEFVTSHPDSPLVLDGYRQLLNVAREDKLDQPQVEKLAEKYLATAAEWGDRLTLRAHVDLGVSLGQGDFLPDLALKYIDAASGKLTPNSPASWKMSLQTQKAKLLIGKGNETEGVALLTTLHQENPYEADLTFQLAQQAEKSKRIDDALALYAELSVLPMMERMLAQSLAQSKQRLARNEFPSEAVRRLWKEKHGNTDKLEDFLNEVYEHKIVPRAGEKVAPRGTAGGTRVVLCELFTGAQCPPCVAADVATAGLEAVYGKTEVIVLRYHQHIPGPDPLANEQSQERFESYQGQGTPTLIVNGRPFPGVGGFLPQVDAMYKRLREVIDPTLTEKSPLKIDLSAKAEKGIIAVSAKAAGLDKFPESVRLRLVVAEDKIAFPAGNGIRFHEMVVRTMPGGVEGVAPQEGKLAFQGEVDLSQLKTQLTKYLSGIETQIASKFEDKPLGFQALHVVAFLQDGSTGEVLQSTSVPVTGTLVTE